MKKVYESISSYIYICILILHFCYLIGKNVCLLSGMDLDDTLRSLRRLCHLPEHVPGG